MIIQSIARYTRFVKSAKVLLSILVVILTALIFFYPIVKRDTGIRIAFTSTTDKSAQPPTQMVNANFHGFDDNNQPYNVTAQTAMQIDENDMVFNKINADLSLNSGMWLNMQAAKGTLKIKERLLSLNGAVEIFNDEGYELHTDALEVDIGKKIAVSRLPVNGQGLLGTLKAQGVVFDGNNKTATFGGRVYVTVHLPPKENAERRGK